MRTRLVCLMFFFAFQISARPLTVDSVRIDSIWSSDSTWFDNVGSRYERKSYDFDINFFLNGEGFAFCTLSMSYDSGATWIGFSDSLVLMEDSGTDVHNAFMFGNSLWYGDELECGKSYNLTIRSIGREAENAILRIYAEQRAPDVFLAKDKIVLGDYYKGIETGKNVQVELEVAYNNRLSNIVHSPFMMSRWDILGDGTWDDTVSSLTWIWNTNVPEGGSGVQRNVKVQVCDKNGSWSNMMKCTVQFGLRRPINMVSIPGGTFKMGTDEEKETERPAHQVTISPFKISDTEISLEHFYIIDEYRYVFQKFNETDAAMSYVTWYDAILFCNKLSKITGKDTCYSYSDLVFNDAISIFFALDTFPTCTDIKDLKCNRSKNGFRLPTEAEWEYACRAGSDTKYFWGDYALSDSLRKYTYVSSDVTFSQDRVTAKAPNPFGLYFITGNVAEWCMDMPCTYTSDSQSNPLNDNCNATTRVIRGRHWKSSRINSFYSSQRDSLAPDSISRYVGFRVVTRGD